MNARDMIALMEYGKAFNARNSFKKETPRFRKKKEKPLDLYELLRKEEEKVTLFKKFIEDFEKTHKKDDKKDKKTMGAIELFILATVFSPLVFLFELWAYSFVVDYIKHMVH